MLVLAAGAGAVLWRLKKSDRAVESRREMVAAALKEPSRRPEVIARLRAHVDELKNDRLIHEREILESYAAIAELLLTDAEDAAEAFAALEESRRHERTQGWWSAGRVWQLFETFLLLGRVDDADGLLDRLATFVPVNAAEAYAHICLARRDPDGALARIGPASDGEPVGFMMVRARSLAMIGRNSDEAQRLLAAQSAEELERLVRRYAHEPAAALARHLLGENDGPYR